ncbi:MAG: phosphoenolpyruvate hydrolase family protein [Pseudomonadota bacterium]
MARRRSTSLVGAAVGSGIVARAAEQGGADFLLAINAGRLRSMGAASIACMLPMHDATKLTFDFAMSEILPMTSLPVYVGVNPWNLQKSPSELARDVLEAGFHGAVNFPTAMHYSRGFRRVLDQAGLGTRAEIGLLRAVEDAGGKSMFFCGTPRQAREGADAGLSALVYNFGWNLGGALGHQPRQSLEEAALQANEVSRYLKRHRVNLKLFLEGGPIAAADDLEFISKLADIDGYVGGSTLDRMPIESSIGDQVASYRLAMDVVQKPALPDRKLSRIAASEGLVGQSQVFQDMLLSVRRAAQSAAPIVVQVPHGGPIYAVLRLLERAFPKHLRDGFVDTLQLSSVFEERSALLFGTKENASEAGLLRRPGTQAVIPDFDRLPGPMQKRLAGAIERGTYAPMGSAASQRVQARLIVVTSWEPPECLAEVMGHTVTIRVPKVADRPGDLDLLFQRAFKDLGADDSAFRSMGPRVRLRLQRHDWHGNEAEISVVARSLLRAAEGGDVSVRVVEDLLEAEASPAVVQSTPTSPREQLVEALARNGFRRKETALALNISRKTLFNRMKKYDLF